MAPVVKSPNDPREYRVIHLDNGLTALLISDTNSVTRHQHHDSSKSTTDEEDTESEDLEGESCDDDDDDDDDEVHEDDDGIDEDENDVTDGVTSVGLDTEEENGSERSRKAKDTKLSAAALCIGAGSFSDPDDMPGLAHFLEHMVFMGSEKYPDENAFDAFIKKHGGSDNASTDCEMTTFIFDVRRKYFRETLDRFAQFFISPLLKEDSVDREIQAVESEFRMSYQSDSVRKMQLLAQLANQHHPFGKFLWGNEQTLMKIPKEKNLDVNSSLRDFRKRMYSAQYMTLAVISRESLDSLEKMVRESFSEIPNNSLPKPTFQEYTTPFDASKFHKLYKVVPVKDVHHLEITWVLPPQQKYYRIKPIHYISWLMGHEGPGSILSLLIKKSWASSLLCGNGESGQEYNTSFALFPCLISLTDEGMEHIYEILTIVFQYVEMLRKKGPQERIYKELQTIENNEFRFREQCEPYDYVEDLVENMQLFPEEDYLTGDQLMWEFNKEVIQDVQDRLTPEKANILLLSKRFQDECTDYEPWFQTPYNCSDIDPEWVESWKNLELNPELHFPEENKFIATDFEIKDLDRAPSEFPELVHDCHLGKVWHSKDTKFKTPRARFYFHLMSPLVTASPESMVLSDVFLCVLEYNLKEIAYAADVAQLGYSMTVNETGIVLKLEGFSHKLPLLFETIIDRIADFSVSTQTFEMVKRKLMRSYRNSIIKPQKLVRSVRLSILQHVKWTTVDKRRVVPNVTIEKLQHFVSCFNSELFVESLIQGNITSQEAISLQEQLYSKLQFMPLMKSLHPEIRVMQLPEGECICRVIGFNKDDDNTVVTNYYQSGPATVEEFTIMNLLLMQMEEPCFDILRTQEQLGYSVFCSCRNTFGVLGFSVTIQTQAGKFSAEHVDSRIDAFLDEFGEILCSLTDEDFKSQVDSLIELKEHEDLSLADEADRNWVEVIDQTYIFNRKRREVEILKNLSKEELYHWFSSHRKNGNKYKKLSVQILGSGQCEAHTCSDSHVDADSGLGNDEDWQIRPLTVDTSGTAVFCVKNISDFKRTRAVYPVVKIK
ncbi:nardilysin-like [Pocillopora damicornis]|uniref:nardilysin-like n=1 Tax=Pocillopora damicornis TaxID=46731 RepID=UPI000F558015|nr:nardilysin-like [Pocillopora damicornis]